MLETYSKYLSDSEVGTLCGDTNFIEKMVIFEFTLAKAESELGLIPVEAAEEIGRLSGKNINVDELAKSTLENGIPVIGLLKQLKQGLSDSAKEYLHWGTTSQDVVDSAQILVIKEVLVVFEERLQSIIGSLNSLVSQHQNTLMAGRTRNQQAAPISFGEKVESWSRPLNRHITRLNQLRPRLLNMQFAGAVGNLSVFNGLGEEVAKKMAKKLDLGYQGTWHSQRDSIAEFSGWMTLVASSLGKMANDILLLTQTEIGELLENGKGGVSSAMPHKNNPILSEAIVGLSSWVNTLNGAVQQTMVHAHERDGKALILEWMALPQMMTTLGTILNHSRLIGENMVIDPERMKSNISNSLELIFSEKVSFVLAKKYGSTKGKQLTGKACKKALQTKTSLSKVLKESFPDLQEEWQQLFNLNKA